MTRTEKQEQLNKLHTERMALQSQLNDSDYKVIKCAEAQAMGAEIPYDMTALHQERQTWRDRINSIEVQTQELEKAGVEEDDATQDNENVEDNTSGSETTGGSDPLPEDE